jgi:hypothetical protein
MRHVQESHLSEGIQRPRVSLVRVISNWVSGISEDAVVQARLVMV